MSKAVISRLVNKYKAKETVKTEHLGGQPKKITLHTDGKVIRYVKKSQFSSARGTIRKLELDISGNAVQQYLNDAGLYSYYAAKKPFVWAKNGKACLEFTNAHRNWTVEQWRQILWSDESKFNLKGSDGKGNEKTSWQTVQKSVHYWNHETWELQRLDGLGKLFRIFWIGTIILHIRYN